MISEPEYYKSVFKMYLSICDKCNDKTKECNYFDSINELAQETFDKGYEKMSIKYINKFAEKKVFLKTRE